MESFGRNLKFLSESVDYLCPIFMDPLTEPYLTNCGHHCCYTCRGRLLASGKSECPECREQDVLADACLNKHLQRQVNSLKVRCLHHEVGCQWVGELRYLQEHLDKTCLLACPLGCGERIPSSAMKDHILSGCSKRSCECEHCGYCNDFDIVTEQHFPLCKMFPVECPNKCFVENLKRIGLISHLEQCPLQVIQCPFTSAGCTVKLPRREMEDHENKAMCQHLRMMMSVVQLKPPQEPPAAVSVTTNQSEYLVNLPPVKFTISVFTKKKECNAEWMSPPFYTHPQGYKFCLVVYPNGYVSTNTHMSVGVLLLEEDDVNIACHLEIGFMIDLLNWREDKQNCQEVIDFNSASNLVTRKGMRRSPIFNKFIPHSSLSYNSTTNTEYLQNDCVRLRVSKVILYSNALLNKTPSWQNTHNGYQLLHEFTLTDFSKRKQFNHRHMSSSFYTQQVGYKFSNRVHANGYGNSKDKCISVYVHQMSGEYDDQLVYGLSLGSLILSCLTGETTITLSIVARHDFVKVTERIFGASTGFENFISHSSLVYDASENTEYLQEDCLRFRINLNIE